jgi:hypothetical protein
MDNSAARARAGEPLIFINYRREDAASAAAFLHAELSNRFGDKSVFLDSESIPLGRDFAPILRDRVRNCAVLIVVVGTRWLKGPIGHRRIDDPDDWVRAEIEEALAHDIPVVPVLVGGARLAPERMPPALAGLVNRQYFEIRDRRQRMYIHNLADYLSRQIPQLRERSTPATRGSRLLAWFDHRRGVIALVVTALLVMAIPRSESSDDSRPPGNGAIEVLAVTHSLGSDTDRITATIRNTHPDPVFIKDINIFLEYLPHGSGHDWTDGTPSWDYSVSEDMSAGPPSKEGIRRTHGYIHMNGSSFKKPLVGRGYVTAKGAWRSLLAFSPQEFLEGSGMVSIVVDLPTTHLLQVTSPTQPAGTMAEVVADFTSGSLLTRVELLTPDERAFACDYFRRRIDDPRCESVDPATDVRLSQ